jgi:hypothetical protein
LRLFQLTLSHTALALVASASVAPVFITVVSIAVAFIVVQP